MRVSDNDLSINRPSSYDVDECQGHHYPNFCNCFVRQLMDEIFILRWLAEVSSDYRVGRRKDGETITDARNRLQMEMGAALDAWRKL